MLDVESVTAAYGKSQVLRGVDLTVGDAETVCLLGRNGMGKTTLLKAIMNLLPPNGGDIRFNGENILGRPTHEISRLGIGYVPQERNIFPDLTVEQNLMVPLLGQGKPRDVSHVYDRFPVLHERRKSPGSNLSGGQQQMLSIGRALSFQPQLLLLDEPSEGLQPSIVKDLQKLLRELQVEASVMLVEQNVDFARMIGDRFYVMEKGRIIAEGQEQDLDLEELVSV